MDKLVESLRVLLENERDGVLHVDKERTAARRNTQAVWKHCGKYWTRRMECGKKDGCSAKTCWMRSWKNENMSNASFFYEAFGV